MLTTDKLKTYDKCLYDLIQCIAIESEIKRNDTIYLNDFDIDDPVDRLFIFAAAHTASAYGKKFHISDNRLSKWWLRLKLGLRVDSAGPINPDEHIVLSVQYLKHKLQNIIESHYQTKLSIVSYYYCTKKGRKEVDEFIINEEKGKQE